MHTAVNVGNTMHKDGVDAVANALIRIMDAKADQKTIREAIKAFSQMAEVKNLTFENITVHGDTTNITHVCGEVQNGDA